MDSNRDVDVQVAANTVTVSTQTNIAPMQLPAKYGWGRTAIVHVATVLTSATARTGRSTIEHGAPIPAEPRVHLHGRAT